MAVKCMERNHIAPFVDKTVRSIDIEAPDGSYHGKVRDTFRFGDLLVLVASDRISAFDHILRQTIPFKGQVLNKLAGYFFEHTSDIVQNHIVSIPDANVTIAKACTPFAIEFVVRGYLAGHAWREYKTGKRVLCGEALPEGLRQNSKLPTPILTPATKAEEGHDEDISQEEIVAKGVIDRETLDQLAKISIALFERGTAMAAERGLILVDTKYEFGQDKDGQICLIDEVHTPDSSRYFYADTYKELLEANKPQRQLSKEFVREWLMKKGFQGLEGQYLPDMPDAFRIEVSHRYIELLEHITGEAFNPDTHSDPISRIKSAIAKSLTVI